SQHHIADRGGINRTEISGHIDFGNAIEITNAAIHHQAAAACGLVHIKEEIVSDNRAADLLPKEIDHQHVTGLQHVYRSLIEEALAERLLGLGLRDVIYVFTHRHELHGESAPDHGLS